MRPVSSLLLLAILPAVPLAAQAVPALDRAEMDTTVHPGDNFYQFVNGGWLARTEIPADRGSYGAFNMADERVQPRLRALVKDAVDGDAKAGSDQRKIADDYTAYLDQDAIDRRGLAPLQAELAAIGMSGIAPRSPAISVEHSALTSTS